MIKMKKILVVEDDVLLSLVLCRFLKRLGFEVTSESHGDNALEKILTGTYHLIIMDIRIKGKRDGIEIMVQAKKTSAVPVIYVTGNSEKATRERAEKTNIKDFLIKPISMDELGNSVKKIMAEETLLTSA